MKNLMKPALWMGLGVLTLGAGLGGMNAVQAKEPLKMELGVEHNTANGHYETRIERVLVGGQTEDRYVPPVYETRTDANGQPFQYMAQAGRTERVVVPAHWENVERQVYVEDYYSSGPFVNFGFGFGRSNWGHSGGWDHRGGGWDHGSSHHGHH